MRHEYQNNALTTTPVGLHHTGALNNWGKMKICKKHLVFEATNKKLDRHRVKNW